MKKLMTLAIMATSLLSAAAQAFPVITAHPVIVTAHPVVTAHPTIAHVGAPAAHPVAPAVRPSTPSPVGKPTIAANKPVARAPVLVVPHIVVTPAKQRCDSGRDCKQ